MTKSCKLINDHVRTRLPIREGMLNILLKQLESIFKTQPYLESLYKTLFSMAYFGLLRVGELTRGAHPISVSDIHIADNKEKVLFILRTSKTHRRNVPPQTIKVESTRSRLSGHRTQRVFCPYGLLRTYMTFRLRFIMPNEQFFIFSDRHPVTPDHMRKKP